MDDLYNLLGQIVDSKMATALTLGAGIGFFLLLRWLTRDTLPKEQPVDPAHAGCPIFQSTLFTAEDDFIPVTVIVHNREEDRHPYILVQTDDGDDVRVPFDTIFRLNFTNNTKDSRRPLTGFGIDYRDFAGDGLLLFVVPGTNHEPTARLMSTIKDSYDQWAARLNKGTLEVKGDSYKRTLVRRSA